MSDVYLGKIYVWRTWLLNARGAGDRIGYQLSSLSGRMPKSPAKIKRLDLGLSPIAVGQNTDVIWNREDMKLAAQCHSGFGRDLRLYSHISSDISPGAKCFCGYFSHKTFTDHYNGLGGQFYPYGVVALCEISGRIVEHEIGYRSQFIRPVKFFLMDKAWSPLERWRRSALCSALARNFGIDTYWVRTHMKESSRKVSPLLAETMESFVPRDSARPIPDREVPVEAFTPYGGNLVVDDLENFDQYNFARRKRRQMREQTLAQTDPERAKRVIEAILKDLED